MAQNTLTMMIDDEYPRRQSPGVGLRIKISGKKREDYQSGEKSEGAIHKLFCLFRKEKWEVQTDLQNYLNLVKREPGNTKARLRLAEIYRKKGKREKAISEYLRTAEIYCRRGLYPQALAFYKRILKENPTLDKVELKIAEIYGKMGLLENAYSQYGRLLRTYNKQGREHKAVEVMCLMAELSMHKIAMKGKVEPPTALEDLQFSEAGGANPNAGDVFQGVPPDGEEKKGGFNLIAELEAGEPMVDRVFKGVITEKLYGFEEIFKELKETAAPNATYPDFNYNMGVACRETGFIDEAIEQFQIALEKGQNPFETAHLLGLCYCEKSCWNEARQSFEEALKVEGISQEMVLKVKNQLALIDAEKTGEEEVNGFSSESPIGSQELRLLYRSQNRKKKEEAPPTGGTAKERKELSL
jgi:tetratricopeptide (TPR) repeat protein